MSDKNFNKQFKADITSPDTDLRCGVILAAGYCVARPQLARLDIIHDIFFPNFET